VRPIRQQALAEFAASGAPNSIDQVAELKVSLPGSRLGRPGGGELRDPPKDRDSLVLLNLLDDLEYRTYSNTGPAAFRPLPSTGSSTPV
jgi:hypothetical protein